jgi:two-component system nitrate/nitrite response regulator NarL
LVDRHRLVLWGLQQLIDGKRPAMEVVGTATDVATATERVAKMLPDVVILDAELVREDAPRAVSALVNGRATRVLLLSGTRDGGLYEAAILCGACGVVHKDEPPETLVKAIAKVHEGQLWLDRATTGRIFVELSRRKNAPANDPVRQKLSLLTKRELAVVHTLVGVPGADNRTLAGTLHIGEHTVRNHLSRIYDKLGVPNRLELFVFAQRHGFDRQSRPETSRTTARVA